MAGFLETFKLGNVLYSATVQNCTETFVNGAVGEKVWTNGETASCLFWRGGANDVVLSERQRVEVNAVAVFDARDLSALSLYDTSRLAIDGQGTFSIVMVDDIAGQGEAIQVFLKEYR